MENKQESKSSDVDIAGKILNKVRRVKLSEEEERKVWLLSYQYVNNWVDDKLGQWTKKVRDEMPDKPKLSFNEVRKFVNRICGAQVLSKIEEKAFPRDDKGDPIIAEILTDLLKYVYDLNQTTSQKSKAFRDMIITGRGFIRTCWSDEEDVMGEINQKRINPLRVYLIGDKEQYDVSKYDEVIDESLMTYDEIVNRYPDKETELSAMKNEFNDKGALEVPVGGYDYAPNGQQYESYDDEVFDKAEARYRVYRSQKYEYVKVNLLNTPDKGFIEIQDKAIKELEKLAGVKLPVVKKRQKKVRVTVTVGTVVLENELSAYKHNKFDIVGWFAFNDAGRITGIVQDLLDPQDEKNKRRSQIIHILGTVAKNGYWVKKGSIDDIEQAKKDLGKVGSLIEINGDINQVAKPIESNFNVVPAIVQMEVQSEQDMKSITGLTDASLGIVPQDVKSGRGINQLQQSVEVIIGELFEHHLMSSKLLADMTIMLIQQYYNEPKRVRILGDYSSKFIPPELQKMIDVGVVQAVQEGAKIVAINTQALNDITVGRYDIVIDATSQNPTTRRAQYFDLLNMKAQGAPIPWSEIIKRSDIKGQQELTQIVLQAEMALGQMTGLPHGANSAPPSASSPKTPIEQDQAFNTAGAQN